MADGGERPGSDSGLTRGETRVSLGTLNQQMALRAVFDTVCGTNGFVFVGFAMALGIAREDMGFVGGAAGFACIIQLLSLPVANRMRDKKRFVLRLALLEPILMMTGIIALPFVPPAWRFPLFAVTVFLVAASVHMSRPLADEWLASTIPAALRGRYVGRRNQIYSAVGIVCTLAAGFIAEHLVRGRAPGLAGMLVCGGLFGLLAVVALSRAVMPALSASAHIARNDFRTMLTNRPFIRLTLAYVIYNIPFAFAVPYYQVFNLTVVNMRETVIALMSTGYGIVRILLLPTLGRAVDRWGPRRTVILVSPVYILFFFVFPVCQPDCQWPLLLAWAAVSVADAAWVVASTQALYGTIPRTRGRAAYFAVWNLCGLLTAALGAMLAAPILRATKGFELTIGTLHLTSFHLFYAACGLVLIPCAFAACWFPGKETHP